MEYTKSELLIAEYGRVFKNKNTFHKISVQSKSILAKEFVGSCGKNGAGSANQHVIKDAFHIIRKEVALNNGQQTQLLDGNEDKVLGEQDFKGNELPATANQLIKKLRVGFKADAATGQAAELVYDEVFPAFVRNSVLVFRQYDVDIIRIPMTEFDPRTTGNNVEDKWKEIKSTPLFGGAEFDVYIEAPKNGTKPTTPIYFEISWAGLES